MPRTNVILCCEGDGSCPFLEWIEQLPVKVQAKCLLRVERLRELGHELRASRQSVHLEDPLFLPWRNGGGRGSWNRERGCRAAKGNRPRH
jgi:hypothetical protein